LTTTIFSKTNLGSPNKLQTTYWMSNHPYKTLLANTGTGKTFAFLVELEKILNQLDSKDCALILCPSRELAQQVSNSYSQLRTGRKSVTCYGGHKFQFEVQQLNEIPTVIIGTPGRIADHFNRGTMTNLHITHLIIDEYDKTLELGFQKEIDFITSNCNEFKSIQLVSATEIEKLPEIFKPFQFQTSNFLEEAKPNYTLFSLKAEGNDKLVTLVKYISNISSSNTLIFCSHREAADRIKQHLKEFGKETALYHGGLEQREREHALYLFKSGCVDTLICTDLASRGLDIPELDLVIHYQFPHSKEDFIHRNGRTARMKAEGTVILLHSESEPLPDYCSNFEFKKLKGYEDFKDFNPSKKFPIYLSAGRKDKIRKIDIVGFFTKEAGVKNEHLGMIEIYDQHSLITLSINELKKIKSLLPLVRIKKQKIKMSFFK
jgi:superfamily II DNA/RNA helicase